MTFTTTAKPHPDPRRTLPAGWRWVQLGEVCEFIRGVSFEKAEASPYPLPGYVPILRAGNIGETLDLRNDLIWVPRHDVSVGQKLQVGDIVICMSSGSPDVVGKTRQLEQAWVGSVGAFCGIIRSRNQDWATYLGLWFRSPEFVAWRDGQARGASIQNLRFSQFETLEIPLPPPDELKRIVAILNEQMAAVERARAAAEAQLQAAKALPAAYLRAVFTSPEARRWVRKPLREICQIVARQVDPKLPEYAALSHVSGENIEGGLCRLSYLNTAAQDGMTSGKYLFDAGDVLYSKLRPYLRKVIVVDFRGVCSADMYPIRVNRDVLDPHFTAWMLVSDEFTKYAGEESRRARMPKLNREQLFAWNARVPPLDEQQRVVARLSAQMAAAEKTRKALEEQLDAINALPAVLLRRAFSGGL